MKRALFILSAVLFGLLLGTGLQFLFVGLFTATTPDFKVYTVWNWLFQIMYWGFIISLSAYLSLEIADDEGI